MAAAAAQPASIASQSCMAREAQRASTGRLWAWPSATLCDVVGVGDTRGMRGGVGEEITGKKGGRMEIPVQGQVKQSR